MGYVYIVLAAVLWGTLGPTARLALAAGIEPLELGFWRALLGGALFAAHAVARRRVRVAPRDLPAVGAFALFAVALFYVAYFRAVRAGGAAMASILLYTAPAWVAVGAALWLGERITGRKLAALALTVAGVALVALGGGGTIGGAGSAVRLDGPALGWGLVAGLAYAAYYLFGKRYFARYEPPTIFAYALPAAALALWPVMRFAPKGAPEWATIAFIAVVPTYLAYLMYGIGLQRVDATRAATVATLEPVVAAGLAYAFWGEALGTLGYTGTALVLAGVLAATAGPEPPEAPVG